MKNMQIMEKVELIRVLQDLLESSHFSVKEKGLFKTVLMNIITNLIK